jgi:hypothetical protein
MNLFAIKGKRSEIAKLQTNIENGLGIFAKEVSDFFGVSLRFSIFNR